MVDDRTYTVECSHCGKPVSLRDLLPNGTTLNLFVDLIVKDGIIQTGRTFVSMKGNQNKKKSVKKKPEITINTEQNQQKELW